MRRRRTPRPGVTAAATTAVLATGAGPGVTALATTAVFATGWPMTPTLPTRAALRGISFSFGRGCVIGLDGGDDCLDRNPSVGDQLATRTSRRRCEWCSPQVLPDENAGRATRLHGSREVLDVVLGQQVCQLGLDCFQLSELADIGELHRLDSTVLVLDQDQHVNDANCSGVDQREQLFRHLAGEVARSRRKFDHEVIDRAEFIQRSVGRYRLAYCHLICPFATG